MTRGFNPDNHEAERPDEKKRGHPPLTKYIYKVRGCTAMHWDSRIAKIEGMGQ